jgi:MarR family 2-MHQ and catechol resistance regulon transcriptional repressor
MNTPTAAPQPASPAGTDRPVGAWGEPAAAEAVRLWLVLTRAFGSVERASSADIARHGLTPAEFGTLDILAHRGPLLLGEIQRSLLVSSGGITFLVDKLVAKGLVERRACPEDRRARYAALTAEGEVFVARVFPEHGRWMRDLLEPALTAEEREELGRLLRKLGRSIDERAPADAEGAG